MTRSAPFFRPESQCPTRSETRNANTSCVLCPNLPAILGYTQLFNKWVSPSARLVNPASQVAHTYTLPPSRGSSMYSSRTTTSGFRRHGRRDGRTLGLSRCGSRARSCANPMNIANAAESATYLGHLVEEVLHEWLSGSSEAVAPDRGRTSDVNGRLVVDGTTESRRVSSPAPRVPSPMR